MDLLIFDIRTHGKNIMKNGKATFLRCRVGGWGRGPHMRSRHVIL